MAIIKIANGGIMLKRTKLIISWIKIKKSQKVQGSPGSLPQVTNAAEDIEGKTKRAAKSKNNKIFIRMFLLYYTFFKKRKNFDKEKNI